MDPDGVIEAFKMLLEQIEEVIENINEKGADAFKKSDYEIVKGLVDLASRISSFRDKIEDSQKEWDQFYSKRVLQTLLARQQNDDVRVPYGTRTTEGALPG